MDPGNIAVAVPTNAVVFKNFLRSIFFGITNSLSKSNGEMFFHGIDNMNPMQAFIDLFIVL